jgi:hypothetical protein
VASERHRARPETINACRLAYSFNGPNDHVATGPLPDECSSPTCVGVSEMSGRTWFVVAFRIAAVSLPLGLLIGLLVRLPGLPYNVRDIFWRGGSLLNLFLFGFFVVSLGAGSAFIAHLAQRARLPALWLMLGGTLVSAVCFVLLTLSVTPESINDIIGSRILVRSVQRGDTVGIAPFIVTSVMRAPALVHWFEGVVRYSALHAPLVIFTTLGLIGFSTGRNVRPGLVSRYATLLVAAVAMLWMCKIVVVDWASTDNLIELIARSGFFGLSGLLWLYMVIAIIGLDAAMLWASIRVGWPVVISLAALALSVPLAWLLLGLGLEHEVGMRGRTYSALQFLLGPDRKSALSEGVLFARWCVVHVGAVAVVASGALLATGQMTARRREGAQAR